MRRSFAIACVLVTASAACELFYPFDVDGGADATGEDANGGDAAGMDAIADATVEAADASVPIVLVTGIYGESLADDDASLYWIATNDASSASALMRTDKADGATTTVLDDAGSYATGLVVQSDVFVWSVRVMPYDAIGGSIMMMARDASTPTVVAFRPDWSPSSVARDDAGVIYVLNSPGKPFFVVSRIAADGGAFPITSDTTTTAAKMTESIALDDQFVYWAHNSQVHRVRHDCGQGDAAACAPEQVVFDSNTDGYGIRDIAIDDASVYWETYSTDSHYALGVYQTPKGMTAPDAAIAVYGATTSNNLTGLTLRDTQVYFVADGTLMRVGKDGSAPTQLAKISMKALVVDDAWVFWIDDAKGRIEKIAR